MSEGGPIGGLSQTWRGASQAQRIGALAFAMICLGLIALVASVARRPQYAVLYANLQEQDAAEVVQRLREMKVPYRVGAGGTIETAADSVHEVRLELAADGLPNGSQTGFELFDKARLGLTEFGEKLNYQRALQGELARTIAHLEPVEEARVHIALPQERLYESEQKKPTASVVLKLRGAATLNSAQVRSVVHLVSGAVEGLAPESVGVMDTRGRLLSEPDGSVAGGSGLATASNQIELRRQYEREIEGAVQTMLDGVIGVGKSVVRASADLNFDQVERERETYQPAANDNGVLESRRETRESYRGQGSAQAVGIPGVSANTGTSATPAMTKGRPGSDEYEHTEVNAQYLVSRERERRIEPPGQVKQVSLSVFIDQEADLGEVKDLTSAISAAAGLNPTRGDTVVITRIPFQPPAEEEKGSKIFAVKDFYFRVGRDFAAIVLAIIFLRFAAGLLRREPRAIEQHTPLPSAVEAGVAYAPGNQATAPEVQIDPEKAAAVLRTWLSSEESTGDNGGA